MEEFIPDDIVYTVFCPHRQHKLALTEAELLEHIKREHSSDEHQNAIEVWRTTGCRHSCLYRKEPAHAPGCERSIAWQRVLELSGQQKGKK